MPVQYILPQSSGDSDPEADPELEKPPDPSGISIRRILRNFVFRSRQKLCYEVISGNDLETPTLDPERNFIDPEKKCWSSG